jgi:hypothetical protein
MLNLLFRPLAALWNVSIIVWTLIPLAVMKGLQGHWMSIEDIEEEKE